MLLSPDSDTSYIFDIVQSVPPTDLNQALECVLSLLGLLPLRSQTSPVQTPRLTPSFCFFKRFHFDSVAHDNDAASYEVLRLNPANALAANDQPLPSIVYGRQRVSKFRRDNSAENLDLVDIYLALYRIPHKKVDLVLSVRRLFWNCVARRGF